MFYRAILWLLIFMSTLFPHESKLLTINDPCLLEGCNKVGDSVIIETKINTVEGILSYIDSKGQIKVKYHAIDAGYTLGYQLDNCEITSIRCFVCCDDRYFELPSCELTTESLNALFGEDQPEGTVFAYHGDANEPDCLWKYKGTGDFLDPDNWVDEYGRLPAQLENMPSDQIAQFVNWLSLIFEGNGISFNANSENGKVIVTVIGDGYVGASSFVVSYEDGYVHLNPGDGSSVVTAMLVEHGDGPPSEPYNWFIFINDLTNSVYLNNNGEAMLLGTLEDSNLDTCTGIINCIIHNLNNPPEQDQYALPELDDAPWIVKQVVYGDSQVADFTDCDGDSLSQLVLALNSCPANPSGWSWVDNGGVLTLCVPSGTGILTISYGSPTAVVNFAGVPTVAGDDYPDLCQEIGACLQARGLAGGASGSELNTEEDVEAAYSSQQTVTVRWKDAQNVQRVSFKDPINGWYHPVDKRMANTTIYSDSVSGSPTDTFFVNNLDVDLEPFGIPNDAAFVTLDVITNITRSGLRAPGATPIDIYASATIIGASGDQYNQRVESADDANKNRNETINRQGRIRVNLDRVHSSIRISCNGQNGAIGQTVSIGSSQVIIRAIGWSR
jgi:hypothetical protein